MPVAALSQPADTVLAAQARTGSPSALGAIYDRHAAMLFRLAYRMLRSAEEAEDLVQDLFVGLPEALRRYDERGRLDAWLRVICTRMALMRLRSTRRLLDSSGDEAAPGESENRLAARITIESALARLSEPLRLVFVLKEVEGYSHAEIALMLGIREGTSEVRLHRATRALRTILRRA